MIFTPNSEGADLQEFNACHHPAGSPTGGEFCSDTVRVGITSARGDKPPKDVFRQMTRFEGDLKQLQDVSGVSVKPGLGAWEGAGEPTWVVSYKGNGEALTLLAKTGVQYDQDAVLVLGGCRGRTGCEAATEWTFDKAIDRNTRTAVEGVMVAAGAGGWTWYKRNGRGMLRWAYVPQWPTDKVKSRADYDAASVWIGGELKRLGLARHARTKAVKVLIMEREGEHAYGRYLAASGRRGAQAA